MTPALCRICNKPRDAHASMMHEFSLTGTLEKKASSIDRVKGAPASVRHPQDVLKGDPVLRMAMVRKGLITADELEEIEQELRAVGAVFDVHSPGSTGRNSEDREPDATAGGMRDPGNKASVSLRPDSS